MVEDALEKVANDGPQSQIRIYSKSVSSPFRLMEALYQYPYQFNVPGDLAKAASNSSKLHRLTLLMFSPSLSLPLAADLKQLPAQGVPGFPSADFTNLDLSLDHPRLESTKVGLLSRLEDTTTKSSIDTPEANDLRHFAS